VRRSTLLDPLLAASLEPTSAISKQASSPAVYRGQGPQTRTALCASSTGRQHASSRPYIPSRVLYSGMACKQRRSSATAMQPQTRGSPLGGRSPCLAGDVTQIAGTGPRFSTQQRPIKHGHGQPQGRPTPEIARDHQRAEDPRPSPSRIEVSPVSVVPGRPVEDEPETWEFPWIGFVLLHSRVSIDRRPPGPFLDLGPDPGWPREGTTDDILDPGHEYDAEQAFEPGGWLPAMLGPIPSPEGRHVPLQGKVGSHPGWSPPPGAPSRPPAFLPFRKHAGLSPSVSGVQPRARLGDAVRGAEARAVTQPACPFGVNTKVACFLSAASARQLASSN